ncbi:MAG: class I SAM-dependent methyltransferase [Kineosporiaceae bacterium]
MDATLLQQLWDDQQTAFMPDREERFRAILDVVELVAAGPPRVLDLAAGTGSITRRLLARRPDATAVVLDVDPSLLAIAAATFDADPRVQVVRADLATPEWSAAVPVPPAGFDAVVTATALHWLPGERVRALYREVRELLAPGGALVNADHLPDDGLPGLSRRADAREREAGAGDPMAGWRGWWQRLRDDPELAPLVAERDRRFGGDHAEGEELTAGWHLAALGEAGFAEAGIVWRGLTDAAVVGVR